MATQPASPSAQLSTLYQRLAPEDLASGIPSSLSMAVGAEIYFADPVDCRRFTDGQVITAGEVLDTHGMVRTFHGPPFVAGFWAEPVRREENRALQAQALHMAILLGARKYVVHSPFSGAGETNETAAALAPAVHEELAHLLAKACDHEVQIVLENCRESGPETFLRVADRMPDPRIGFCLDLAHLHITGGEPPAAWFRALGSRLTHLHLSDNDGQTDGHLPFGTGTVDLAPLVETLARTGHAPTACLETPIGSMITSLAALERAGLSWGEDGEGL